MLAGDSGIELDGDAETDSVEIEPWRQRQRQTLFLGRTLQDWPQSSPDPIHLVAALEPYWPEQRFPHDGHINEAKLKRFLAI